MNDHQARLRLRGDIGEVVSRFTSLPHRQLLVLGSPGSGKSVLSVLFVLDYLRHRSPEDAVPVILYLPTWRPDREHLHDWMARRLVEDYPFLADGPKSGHRTVRELISAGRILPILDGLDELPPDLHAIAINNLDRNMGGGPMVVTCRSEEYQQAVEQGGNILTAAAVVEIEPVRLKDAATFLVLQP